MSRVCLVFACVLALVTATRSRFDGDKVWRLQANASDSFLGAIRYAEAKELDVWAIHDGSLSFDVRTNPKAVLDLLSLPGLESSFLMIDDVQALIDEQEASRQPWDAEAEADTFYDNYRSYEEIRARVQSLAAANGATFIPSIGRTVGGRDIFAIRFGGTRCTGTCRAVILQGGIHAREWIAPATTMFVMEHYLTSTDPAVVAVRDQLEINVVPLLNADGYEFSRTGNRLWRKNRSANPGSICIGTDLNRNWGDHWGGGGSSPNPCADTYRGRAAFSELETAAVRDYLASQVNPRKRVHGGMDLHAYGQLVLRPHGWCLPRQELPPNNVELRTLGDAMRDVIRATTGSVYTSEHAAELYVAAGGADDWFYSGATNRGLAYTLELRDRGLRGFLLPPDQIVPTGTETLEAFKLFARAALTRTATDEQ